ncbi:MAG: pyruvate kinase [Phenylobacterium sp.]|uniref:pyruvate kinase n=1 Tax=Phenylobacterium sp. TaxID=1871053 RepID=UPI002730CDB7|nr:pyruvate kinase [Phenylobacterium sp.]MDP2012083.1 pyruvate kinase [Phenylobacterium sp.]MDP3631956.1 pyruvate kinase [Phenylobacterium sp.]MDP3870901.1 pyruvate kinase [Phenylobacterium sp.]
MIRARRARIVATLGPASRDAVQIRALAEAGADVFRVNFSHGDHEDHARTIANVRAVEALVGRPLAVLADLQGPKLRLGEFADGRVRLKVGQDFRLDRDTAAGDASRVCVPHAEIFAALKPGADILLDDGKVRLKVGKCGPDFADTVVVAGEALSDHKGLNLPGLAIPIPALTPKDLEDLNFALSQGVDWVALSFVQRASDMAELRQIVQGRAGVLAKIEKPAALEALDEILDLCEAVMVARGDLGVELNPEDVPVVQKSLIRAARTRGIPVIVATQMLESMISAPTPTRAEASDVAGAVYEGADAVMLSAETAAGQYPVEAVTIMDRIITRVERDPRWPELMRAEYPVEDADADALVAAARRAAEAASTACLVAFTTTGQTALRLSRERPLQPTLALTTRLTTARRLALAWGVESRVVDEISDPEDLARVAVDVATEMGLAPPGHRVLILAGLPMGSPGAANILRLAHTPIKR